MRKTLGGCGRSSSGFSPLSLSPTTWWDFAYAANLFTTSAGSTNVSSDGDPIGKVLDLSGNSRHLSQATNSKRGSWSQLARNGLGAMQTDGVDDNLFTAAVANGVGTGDFAFCAVVSIPDPASVNFLPILTVNQVTPGMFVKSGKLNAYFAGDEPFNTALVQDSWHTLTVTRRSGTIYGYLDGAQQATTYADSTSMTNNEPYYLCARRDQTASQFWPKLIAELVVLPAASATLANITPLQTYFKAKWSTP